MDPINLKQLEAKNTKQTLYFLANRQENLPFLKSKRTLQDMLLCEIASALIQQNIRPGSLKDCYRLAGLTHEPNLIFLVQIDDYYKHYYSLPSSRGFYLKESITKCLRDTMDRLQLEGFTANMVGTTNIIMFIHFPVENEEAAETIERLLQVAEEFKRDIYRQVHYLATIGISSFCHGYRDFATAYQEVLEILYRSVIVGREQLIYSMDDKQEAAPEAKNVQKDLLLPLMQALREVNKMRYRAAVVSIVQKNIADGAGVRQIRLNLIHTINEIEIYASRLEIDRELLADISTKACREVGNSRFITDIYQIMDDYFEALSAEIVQPQQSNGGTFKQLVDGYLAGHYAESVDLRTMAQLCNYSAIHFGRLFKKNYGENFSQYLTKYRLTKSVELLHGTHDSIENVAIKSGFNSVSYFCTTFKNHMGLSPKKYRENKIWQQ